MLVKKRHLAILAVAAGIGLPAGVALRGTWEDRAAPQAFVARSATSPSEQASPVHSAIASTPAPHVAPRANASTPTAYDAPRLIVQPARWPLVGADLPTLIRSQGVLVSGVVTASRTLLLPDPETGELDDVYTVSTISVKRVVSVGGAQLPGEIDVIQDGGLKEDSLFQVEGDPLLVVGAEYVLILDPPAADKKFFTGLPFGRTQVAADGNAKSVDPLWADTALASAVAGRDAQQAENTLFELAQTVGLR